MLSLQCFKWDKWVCFCTSWRLLVTWPGGTSAPGPRPETCQYPEGGRAPGNVDASGGTIMVRTASSQAVPCGSPLQRKVHWSRKLRPLQVQLSSERALFHTARGLGNYLWQWLAWQPRERLIWTRNNCVCFIKSNSSPCPCVMAV